MIVTFVTPGVVNTQHDTISGVVHCNVESALFKDQDDVNKRASDLSEWADSRMMLKNSLIQGDADEFPAVGFTVQLDVLRAGVEMTMGFVVIGDVFLMTDQGKTVQAYRASEQVQIEPIAYAAEQLRQVQRAICRVANEPVEYEFKVDLPPPATSTNSMVRQLLGIFVRFAERSIDLGEAVTIHMAGPDPEDRRLVPDQ